MKKRVFFYSSAGSPELIKITGFLATDIKLLEELGLHVFVTNKFSDFLKFWKYDIVFAYFWSKSIVPVFLARVFLKKSYVTGGIDQLDSNYNKSKFDFFIRSIFFMLVSNIATKSLIVSNSDFDNINKHCITRDNLVYAPHSIDVRSFLYTGNKISHSFTTVAWMESIENVRRKGVDRFLYIFKEYLTLSPGATLKIIGSLGEGSDYLKSIVSRLDIDANVQFLGRISEVAKIHILKMSRFYVQLSIYEGFGIAALEGLAASNIVVHSAKGGLADVVDSFGLILSREEENRILAHKIYNLGIDSKSVTSLLMGVNDYVLNKFDNSVRKNIFKQCMEI